MFVPVCRVTVVPAPNGQRPSIEKTTRSTSCPVYMVPMFKEKWGITGKIVVDQLPGEYWRVPKLPSLDHCDSEILRLKQYFKDQGKTFDATYKKAEFREKFEAVAVDVNPADEARAKREELLREESVERAAKGVIQAAATASVRAARGRPRKVVPTVPVEA